MASIFTKIIQGELPSYKIYEDEFVFSFLSIEPVSAGHTLVVPKVEIDQFIDLPEPYSAAIFRAAKPIARAIQAVVACKRVGLATQGFEVPHFHLHLIPLNSPRDFDFRLAKRLPDAEMVALHKKILGGLKL